MYFLVLTTKSIFLSKFQITISDNYTLTPTSVYKLKYNLYLLLFWGGGGEEIITEFSFQVEALSSFWKISSC